MMVGLKKRNKRLVRIVFSLSRTRIRFWNRVELSFVLGSIVFEISWDWRYWKRSGVC